MSHTVVRCHRVHTVAFFADLRVVSRPFRVLFVYFGALLSPICVRSCVIDPAVIFTLRYSHRVMCLLEPVPRLVFACSRGLLLCWFHEIFVWGEGGGRVDGWWCCCGSIGLLLV